MNVTMEQVQRGTAAYYEAEFCQKAEGLGKFAAYFLLPSLPGMVKDYADKLKATPIMAGIVNADGLFDIDAARDRAMSAMEHCGNVELMGFRLNTDDVDKLHRYIKEA